MMHSILALEAIRARIEGDLDHPALMRIGLGISTNTLQDCLFIAHAALEKYKMKAPEL